MFSEPNIPEELIIDETNELKTFFFNVFNVENLGPGLAKIKQPMLNILLHYSRQPDLQSYLFLRWIKSLLTVAINYNIKIVENKLCDVETEKPKDVQEEEEEQGSDDQECVDVCE